MSWGPVTGVAVEGVTTIRWGTEGAVGGGLAVAAVLGVRQNPIHNTVRLKNGSGLTTTRVRVKDGQSWEVSLRDDTRLLTLPRQGTLVTVVDVAGHLGAQGLSYTARVVESPYSVQAEQPGERTLTLERLTLIEGA
jgi:hypothetical protein